MGFGRERGEWLAGEIRDVSKLYRAGVRLLNQAGTDINLGDRMSLALGHARLGDEKAAMRELAAATADKRWSQAGYDKGDLWNLAKIQLALDKKAAAIDSLDQAIAYRTPDGRPAY